jgi:hypothetical protein
MKLILFLAAIYSLIIHQSRKNSWETVIPGEQKITTQKVINRNSPSFIKWNSTSSIKPYQQQQLVFRSDSLGRSGFVSSNNPGTRAKWNEKD